MKKSENPYRFVLLCFIFVCSINLGNFAMYLWIWRLSYHRRRGWTASSRKACGIRSIAVARKQFFCSQFDTVPFASKVSQIRPLHPQKHPNGHHIFCVLGVSARGFNGEVGQSWFKGPRICCLIQGRRPVAFHVLVRQRGSFIIRVCLCGDISHSVGKCRKYRFHNCVLIADVLHR